MKRYIGDLVYLSILAALVLYFFRILFFPTAHLLVTPDFGRSDAWHSSFASKFLLSQALKHWHLPLWSPLVGAGYPVFAEGLVGALFLPHILLFTLLDVVLAYNISMVLYVFLAGA